MGSFASCSDLVPVSLDFGSCLSTLGSDDLCAKHGQSACSNTKNIVMKAILDDTESYSTSEEEDFDESIVKELDTSFFNTLHIHDPPESFDGGNSVSDEAVCNPSVKLCSFDNDMLKVSSKQGLVLCSEIPLSSMVSSGLGDASTQICLPSEVSPENGILESLQSVPATKKLIPALKGSRARHGIELNTKLSVKWAPDVYDPPITSSSHTIKGRRRHHQHNHVKTKKDHHYHKYKGKSSRSSVSDRKHTHRRSSSGSSCVPDIWLSRMQFLRCDVPLQSNCGKTKFESLDLTVGSVEASKLRSSCYMEVLPQVQLSIAKAS